MSEPRLAVIRDYRSEGWPSMDLCADQLLAHLAVDGDLTAKDFCPPFRRLVQRLPLVGRRRAAFNFDRLVNRHHFLSTELRRRAAGFDVFHVVDHSYAHVVLSLPSGRAGVYCHDLDAFRCLLEPARDPRPRWFRRLASQTLRGLRAAAVVFHGTSAIREQLLLHDLVDSDRLVQAPYGVASEFTQEGSAADCPPQCLPSEPILLHVGSHIPRKRVDVLIDVFAAVRARIPEMKLVQVGPTWSLDSASRIDQLGVAESVVQMRGLSRGQLAALYRRATVVVVPSESEGFGLPVIEALACGAPVVASDIPTLREAGGTAAVYCPVGDVPAWAEATLQVVSDPGTATSKEIRRSHARRFSWQEHARVIGDAYHRLAG
jgi:glycosyltransferase involved in cell wall biosynthesis